MIGALVIPWPFGIGAIIIGAASVKTPKGTIYLCRGNMVAIHSALLPILKRSVYKNPQNIAALSQYPTGTVADEHTRTGLDELVDDLGFFHTEYIRPGKAGGIPGELAHNI